MPAMPDFSWLADFVPFIACGTFAIVVFAVGVIWILSQQLEPGQSHTDPYSAWELHKAHNWQPAPARPGEEELTEEELEEWDNWQGELGRLEEMQLAEVNAEIARRRDQAERLALEESQIKQDFPEWLIKFGESYGLSSYAGLVRLAQFIAVILNYCNDHLEGRMPIKQCYQIAQDGGFGQAPNLQCYGRTFYEMLSKALAQNGLLSDGRGTVARKITPDALVKLQRPSRANIYASNVQ